MTLAHGVRRRRDTPGADLWSTAGRLWFGGAGIANLGRRVSDDDARATVDAAWDGGVRGFDTAPHYGLGLGEQRLGAALRDRPRDEFVLSSKVGRVLVPSDEGGDDLAQGFAVASARRRQWDFSADGVRRSLLDSLSRLGLDRVDVALLHDPEEHDLAAALTTGLTTLAALRDEGVVRAVGVGSKSVAALEAARATGIVDVLMVAGRYTLLEQPAAGLLGRCADDGTAVLAAGVYNSGLLSRPDPDASLPYEYGEAPPHLVDRARALAVLCRRAGVSLPEVALAHPLRAPAVRAVVVGAQTPGQARENVARSRATVPEALWDQLGVADVR